ncbi:hypothetical protein [Metabacillus litoralis]|uniref:Uncharacterized protein n=1 Tax=Metabacillus litoralis TaxID=152268 RepID=A0A179SYL9_9BACI|nr:hypothetical protein [Metabacillus litoralis]OAS86857.1 hypothetical protein A6K24_04990 [Metabacillus litoralis]
MNKIFSRYSHWLALIIIGFSFITMFINFKIAPSDIIAVIFGGIGLLSVGYLAFVVEKHIRKQREEK